MPCFCNEMEFTPRNDGLTEHVTEAGLVLACAAISADPSNSTTRRERPRVDPGIRQGSRN